MHFAIVSLNPPITLSYIPTVIHVLQLCDFSQLCTILHNSNFFQDVCQKCSKHPLLTVACNQRWGLKSIVIIFSDTKNNKDISCLLKFQFLCFPPYQTFHKMQPPMKKYCERKALGGQLSHFQRLCLRLCRLNLVVTIRDLISPWQIYQIIPWCQCLSSQVCLEKQSICFVQTENKRLVS